MSIAAECLVLVVDAVWTGDAEQLPLESSRETSKDQMAQQEDMPFFLISPADTKMKSKTVKDGQMAQCSRTKSIILTVSVSAKRSLSQICVYFNWGFSSFMSVFKYVHCNLDVAC